MHEELIVAGFGGQGVLVTGQLLAYAGMLEGKNVSWIPSYGPEMRGGTANCSVVISRAEVASPLVNEPTSLIIMNKPSLIRFEQLLRPEGVMVYDCSIIDVAPRRSDIDIVAVHANRIAEGLGEPRVANMVLLGAYLARTNVVAAESIIESLRKVLPARRHHLIPVNKIALEEGTAAARSVAS